VKLISTYLFRVLLAGAALGQTPSAPPAPQAGSAPATPARQPARTISQVLDRMLSGVERDLVSAAEAMPEDKYNFAPTAGTFQGVRTFGEQLRHAALTNHQVFSAILGQPVPEGGPGDNGPALKSKAEIVQYLRDSFALAHKAVATINEANVVAEIKNPYGQTPTTRLAMTLVGFGHCFNHYGQIVEYLRMNGTVPPASR
jgi:uncharacterized damage-inducible protein DinB